MKAGYRSLCGVVRVLTVVAMLAAATVITPTEPARAGGGVTAEVQSGNLVITINPSSPELRSQFAAFAAGGDEADAPTARIIAGGQAVKSVPLHGPYLDSIERTGRPDAPFQIVLPISGELGVPGQVSIQVQHQGSTLDSAETSVDAIDIGGAPAPGGREEGQQPGGSRSEEEDRTEPGGSRSEEPDREEPREPQGELQPPSVEEPEDPEAQRIRQEDVLYTLKKMLDRTAAEDMKLNELSLGFLPPEKRKEKMKELVVGALSSGRKPSYWDQLTDTQKDGLESIAAFLILARLLSKD